MKHPSVPRGNAAPKPTRVSSLTLPSPPSSSKAADEEIAREAARSVVNQHRAGIEWEVGFGEIGAVESNLAKIILAAITKSKAADLGKPEAKEWKNLDGITIQFPDGKTVQILERLVTQEVVERHNAELHNASLGKPEAEKASEEKEADVSAGNAPRQNEILQFVDAAKRLVANEYLHWTFAGGVNDCEHGYAEGVPCPKCDTATIKAFNLLSHSNVSGAEKTEETKCPRCGGEQHLLGKGQDSYTMECWKCGHVSRYTADVSTVGATPQKSRHTGFSAHRLNPNADNPREVAFAYEWREQVRYGMLGNLIPQLTERDERVAATIIQWLGSNVGMCFLRDVAKANGQVKEFINS